MSLSIQNDRVSNTYTTFHIFNENYNIDVVVIGLPKLVAGNEDHPDVDIRHFPRYGDHSYAFDFTPLALQSEVERAYKPKYSCLWGLRPCTLARDFLPKIEEFREQIARERQDRLSSADPCPAKNMYQRIRDSETVAIGLVGRLNDDVVSVKVGKVLKGEPFGPDVSFRNHTFTTNGFIGQVQVGDELILIDLAECNPLPANRENLIALQDALKRLDSEQ